MTEPRSSRARPGPRARRGLPRPLLLLAILAILGVPACAHMPRAYHHAPLGVDSVTVSLWHMDESTGSEVQDSGPSLLHGTAGLDARPQYGRFDQARHFTASINSFVLVPTNPLLEGDPGITIEAWVNLDAYGDYLDTPIADCWSPAANQQSWILTVLGRRTATPPASAAASGDHLALFPSGAAGKLAFAFQPQAAGAPQAFFSTRSLPLSRWTHVAACYDGQVVRLWINGALEGQFVSRGRIAQTAAPLMIGNALDPRTLTTFGGYLRADSNADPIPYYALQGAIDELRISSVARDSFPYGIEP